MTSGLEVPLHRSLVDPILLVGLPRTLALVLWTAIGAVGLGLRQIWVLPIGVFVHVVAAAAAKSDPYFFDVFLTAIRIQRRLEP